MSLDKLQLDSMVQGLEDDVPLWKMLLSDPKREETWREAVKRREQLDLFCAFVCRWPLLAKSIHELKKLMKASENSPLLTLKNNFSSAPFLATLNQESQEVFAHINIGMVWGEKLIVEVEDQTSVIFDSNQKVKIHYQYGDSSGWITSDDSWAVDGDDGAVVLTFLDTEYDGHGNLLDTINTSKSVGCVIFMPI